MKKWIVFLFCVMTPLIAQADFYVAGDFNGWNAAGNIMTNNGGLWSVTVGSFTPGARGEWKVTIGDWSQTWPGSGNAWYVADGSGNVTFRFNANTLSDGWVPSTNIPSFAPPAATNYVAVGDFQSWNNNDSACYLKDDGTQLGDVAGDGIYVLNKTFAAAGWYQFKVVKAASWDAIGDDGLGVNSNTTWFEVTSAGQVIRFRCDVNNCRNKLDKGPFTPAAPSAPKVVSHTQTSIRWGWTDESYDEIGFNIYAGAGTTAPVDRTTTVAANSTYWDHNSLTPNTAYAFQVSSFSDNASAKTTNLTTYTLAAAPSSGNNVTCDRASGTPYTLGTKFTFSNPAGFGAGTHGGSVYMVSKFRYVFDTNSTYTFVGSESLWDTGSLEQTPGATGSYYLHLQSLNQNSDPTASTLDFGPFVIGSATGVRDWSKIK